MTTINTTTSKVDSFQEIFSKFGPLCNSEGFYQHSGQCWSDAIQMLMLYTDGIKEVIQPKLALAEVSEDEIKSKFLIKTINLLVDKKLIEPTNSKNPLIDNNLKAIKNYFLAVQSRFQRHYMAEYKRLSYLGPIECDNYDKIGSDALEFLKEVSKSSRSVEFGANKPGIRSAIMGKINDKYLLANREQIGKQKTATYGKGGLYESGGSPSDFQYIINLYSSYFDIKLTILDYTAESTTSTLLNAIYISSSPSSIHRNRHATCFYTCGSTDYYFDDNEGVLEFPWHSFLLEFEKLKKSFSKVSIRFTGTYSLLDKKNTEILNFKLIPTLHFKIDKQDTYITYIKGQIEPIKLVFEESETVKIVEMPLNTLIQKIEINKSFFYFEPDKLYGIQSEVSTLIPSKYNVYTGKAFPSRLKPTNSLLIKGIQSKNIEKIKKGLNQKENIQSRNSNGNTVLHAAVELNDIDFVKYLLGKKDIDIDAQNSSGYTPLMVAVILGNYEIALMLLEIGSTISIRIPKYSTSNPGFNVVDLAVEISNSLFKKIFEQNQMNKQVEFNRLLDFLDACLQKDSNLQKYVYSVKKALSSNNINVIKIFVKHGFNINQILFNLDHPIQIAADNENIELFLFILDLIPSIDELSRQNIYIFNNVITGWRNKDVGKAIDSLVKKGYDPTKKFFGGINYLWTTRENPNAFFHLLRTYNLDVNPISRDGDSLLILLTKLSEYDFTTKRAEKNIPVLEMMEEVLKRGANVNFQEKRTGNTALMFAAKIPSDTKIRLLCKYGADPTLKNKENHDVYWFIQESLKIDPDEKQAIKEAIQICKDKQKAKRLASKVETAPSAEVAPAAEKLGGGTRKKRQTTERGKSRKIRK
jgi:ankyrin repeat protein